MTGADSFEVLVDLQGLALVRVNGELRADIHSGFRSAEEVHDILSQFWDI